MSTPNELRVFISSTFRDLQDEREHLVKKIFPEMIRPSAGVARSAASAFFALPEWVCEMPFPVLTHERGGCSPLRG